MLVSEHQRTQCSLSSKSEKKKKIILNITFSPLSPKSHILHRQTMLTLLVTSLVLALMSVSVMLIHTVFFLAKCESGCSVCHKKNVLTKKKTIICKCCCTGRHLQAPTNTNRSRKLRLLWTSSRTTTLCSTIVRFCCSWASCGAPASETAA